MADAYNVHFWAMAMLFTGACTMSLRDFMDVKDFHYPVHWAWMSQVGFSAMLPIHHYIMEPQDPGHLPFVHKDGLALPVRCYFICVFFDAGAMTLGYCALGTISAGVFQMMRSTKLLMTFFVSVKFMGKKQMQHHYLGVSITVTGLLFVIAGSFQHSTHNGKLGGKSEGLGFALLLCLLAECLNTCLFVYQEHITKQYDLKPLKLVGTMGCIGVVVFTLLLCVLNPLGIESTRNALDKMGQSGFLVLGAVFYTMCAGCYDLAGVYVSKHSTAVTRAMVDVARSAAIWVVELYFHWVAFKFLHLIGFAVIVLGNFVYNGILVVPGMEEEEAAEEAKRKKSNPETEVPQPEVSDAKNR